MDKGNSRSDGFTLIAALMLLVLMSGLAVGLFMMVNTEQHVGGNSVQNAIAQREAEGGLEKMTSDIADQFQTIQNPQVSDITGLDSHNPDANTFVGYTLVPAVDGNGKPLTNWNLITSGSYQGLYAQTWNITLTSIAQAPAGQQAAMTRQVQEVLVPVFQFGAFCNGDCTFSSNPTYDFNGRFHANGDMYLGVATGSTLTFHDKVEAYGNIIRMVLPNGTDATTGSANDSGSVRIPTASGGCDGAQTACLTMSTTAPARWGSVKGNASSSYNSGPPSWQTVSQSKYNGFLIDGDYGKNDGTGAKLLNLPFVNGTTVNTNNIQHEIIQEPPAGENPNSGVGPYRLYNQAQIRVLLADDPTELTGAGAADPQNVRLANWNNPGVLDYSCGVPLTGTANSMYFATASTHVPNPSTLSGGTMTADWQYAPFDPPNAGLLTLVPTKTSAPAGTYNAPLNTTATGATPPPAASSITLQNKCNTTTSPIAGNGGVTIQPGQCYPYPYYINPAMPMADKNGQSTWNLLDGWLRVEAFENGAWTPVTQEWLGLGFARGVTAPSSGNPNSVNPNAILILEEPADRNHNGTLDALGNAGSACTANKKAGVTISYTCSNPPSKAPEVQNDAITGSWQYGKAACGGTPSYTQYNWYPINMYDPREGEDWDNNAGLTTCSVNGIMNAVEIDVGNLKKWLAGSIGATGNQVSPATTNGYVLYFSDRRGMLQDSTGNKVGEYGFEDTINLANNGVPNGTLEPDPPNKTQSPEDVNGNGLLDTYGAQNVGLGFGMNGGTSVNASINAGTLNPYVRVKGYGSSCTTVAPQNWVSGARHVLKLVDGYLGNVPQPGFTVASENPVYVQGDYNSNSGDPVWTGGTTPAASAAAASIIADAVTLLSNSWNDYDTISSPQDSQATQRKASTTYYRMAIAAGKPLNFQNPGAMAFGTDGGMGNFLRFIENWCANGGTGCTGAIPLYYMGSMVSLYNSVYATGTFKCCNTVYNPPDRNFAFDQSFKTPAGLPPATPMFRDVDNLSSRQLFTQRANATP